MFWALNIGCVEDGLKKEEIQHRVVSDSHFSTKLSIVELVFNSYWLLWQTKRTLLHHSVISLASLVLGGVRWTNKELLQISLVFSYGSRNNSSKLRNKMSSRCRRNKMDKVDDTLHRISGPKGKQRRKYHNITCYCRTVFLCHRQNWLYVIL